MELSSREKKIIQIVKRYEPVTGDFIAKELSVSKSALRVELGFLVKLGILISKTNVGYFYNDDFSEAKQYDVLRMTKVKEVMGIAYVSKSTDSISEIITKLFLNDIGTIFIVNEQAVLSGVVSRKDTLKMLVANANAGTLPVAMAMTRVPNVVCLNSEDSVLDALKKIIHHAVDCLPVVEENEDGKKIIGRISKTTIIRMLLDIVEG